MDLLCYKNNLDFYGSIFFIVEMDEKDLNGKNNV